MPIPLDGVSREHARIKWDGKGWWLEDLKSTNGTFVNGEKVAAREAAAPRRHQPGAQGRRRVPPAQPRRAGRAATQRKGVVRAALVDARTAPCTRSPSASSPSAAPRPATSWRTRTPSRRCTRASSASSDQLLLEDLSSSNGTFVNGTRVRTAVLRDGDTLELANVAQVQGRGRAGRGERVRPLPRAHASKEGEPKFSGEWKTRYEWDPAELAAIAAAAAGLRPPELDRGPAEPPAGPKHVVQAGAKKASRSRRPPPARGQAGGAAAAGQAARRPPRRPRRGPSPVGPRRPRRRPRRVPVPRPSRRSPRERPPGVRPRAGAAPTPAGTDPASTPSEPRLAAAASGGAALADRPRGRAGGPSAARARPRPAPAPPRPRRAPADFVAGAAGRWPHPRPPRAFRPRPPPSPPRVSRASNSPSRSPHPAASTWGAPPPSPSAWTTRRSRAAMPRSRSARIASTLIVEDLGAANGTRVNRAEIKGTQELQDGDVLELGEVRFT